MQQIYIRGPVFGEQTEPSVKTRMLFLVDRTIHIGHTIESFENPILLSCCVRLRVANFRTLTHNRGPCVLRQFALVLVSRDRFAFAIVNITW